MKTDTCHDMTCRRDMTDTARGYTPAVTGSPPPQRQTQPFFPPHTPPNEPRPGLIAPTAADTEPDSQPSGATDSANGCAGVANSAPQPRRGGKRGRSGPPANSNARTTGAFTVRRERKELRSAAMDGRTGEAHYVADQRADLLADIGGADNVTAQQRWLADEASFLRLELAYVRTFLAENPPISRKRRAAHPILKDYLAMVNALRSILSDLGLERRAKDTESLDVYLSRRAQLAGSNAATDAFTPGTQPGAAGSAPAGDGGEDGDITGTTRAP